MSAINTRSMRSRAVALAAFAAASAAAVVLSAPVRHAEAAPAAAIHQLEAYTDPNPAVHNVRVIRKVTSSTGQKKVIRAGRNYDKSTKFKQVIVNGKRVPRRVDTPVIRDHRTNTPTVRDHRVNGGVTVRNHRVTGGTVRDHRVK